MSGQENSSNIADWLSIARRDWTRAKYMLEKGDVIAAAFFLQQSVEKYLKAFLLKQGWILRKIHRVDALLDDAIKYNPDLKNFYDLCERVSGYYIADRYPPLKSLELTCGDVERDMNASERFIKAMFPKETLKTQ